jgi:hypothetical protein
VWRWQGKQSYPGGRTSVSACSLCYVYLRCVFGYRPWQFAVVPTPLYVSTPLSREGNHTHTVGRQAGRHQMSGRQPTCPDRTTFTDSQQTEAPRRPLPQFLHIRRDRRYGGVIKRARREMKVIARGGYTEIRAELWLSWRNVQGRFSCPSSDVQPNEAMETVSRLGSPRLQVALRNFLWFPSVPSGTSQIGHDCFPPRPSAFIIIRPSVVINLCSW